MLTRRRSALLLLLLLTADGGGVGSSGGDAEGAPGCEVGAPVELAVFYVARVDVQLLRRGRHGQVQVVVDGAAVATVDCPGSFALNHLAAGPHVLSLAPAGAALRSSARNTSFFVAHDMFREGQPSSPLQLSSRASTCDAAGGEAHVCAKGGGVGVKFWVLMTGYNAAQWIDKAILSLRRQRYCDFTCVIIDDASTDDTLRVARYIVNIYNTHTKTHPHPHTKHTHTHTYTLTHT